MNEQMLKKMNEIAKEHGIRYELRTLDPPEGDEKDMQVYFKRYDLAFHFHEFDKMGTIIHEFQIAFPHANFDKMYCRSVTRHFNQAELIEIKL